jgi:hypothetical protein
MWSEGEHTRTYTRTHTRTHTHLGVEGVHLLLGVVEGRGVLACQGPQGRLVLLLTLRELGLKEGATDACIRTHNARE